MDALVVGARGRGGAPARAPPRGPAGASSRRRSRACRPRSRPPTACCAGTARRNRSRRQAAPTPGTPTPRVLAGRGADLALATALDDACPAPAMPDEHEARAPASVAAQPEVAAEQAGATRSPGRARASWRSRAASTTRTIESGRPGAAPARGATSQRAASPGRNEAARTSRARDAARPGRSTSVMMPSRPSEPRTSWRRSGPAATPGGAAGPAARPASRRGRRRTAPRSARSPIDCWPAERAATQPPTVERSNDCGKWPSVSPCGAERRLERRPDRAGPERREAARLVEVATARRARRGRRRRPAVVRRPDGHAADDARPAAVRDEPRPRVRGARASRSRTSRRVGRVAPRRPARRRAGRSAGRSSRAGSGRGRGGRGRPGRAYRRTSRASRDGGTAATTSSSVASPRRGPRPDRAVEQRRGRPAPGSRRPRPRPSRSSAASHASGADRALPAAPRARRRRVAATGSERRPGDRRPGRRREREPAVGEQPVDRAGSAPGPRPPTEQVAAARAAASPSEALRGSAPARRARRPRTARRASPTARSAAWARPRSITPWSTPWMCRPPSTGRMWPPLRSVLLIAASKTAIRRSRGSSSTTIATTSTVGSGSMYAWSMPSPNGPSRRTVGGTMPQPLASDTCQAATSRRASVPSGKSSSGRSPSGRLVDRVDDAVGGSGSGQAGSPRTNSALLVDSTIRPTTSISPSRRTSSVVARSSTRCRPA